MNYRLGIALAFIFLNLGVQAQEATFEQKISLKTPGNPAKAYILQDNATGVLKSSENIPVEIYQKRTDNGSTVKVEVTIKAKSFDHREGFEGVSSHGINEGTV